MKRMTITGGALASALLLTFGCDKQQQSSTPDEAASDSEMQPAAGLPSDEAPATTATKVQRPRPFPSFVTFDRNGDKEVTKEEFQAALQENNVLFDWDGDGDGELTDVEYETAFYRAWDINGDEVVDIYEYKNGSGAYFPTANAYGIFEDYDLDGDKELSMTEFASLARKVYTDWDADGDGELIDKEFQTALYDAWDLNGDGIVDHYEYRWE